MTIDWEDEKALSSTTESVKIDFTDVTLVFDDEKSLFTLIMLGIAGTILERVFSLRSTGQFRVYGGFRGV